MRIAEYKARDPHHQQTPLINAVDRKDPKMRTVMVTLRFTAQSKIFSSASDASKIPVQLVLFRSCNSPFEPMQIIRTKECIWEAARCSSAAPTYFSNVGELIDGGICANNPSNELLNEVYLCNEWAKQKKNPKLNTRNVENIAVVFEPTF
ncbi:hypothetical protein niasHS_017913 [Heterodera schachtii]|uniref:PNPLA domain-containing protein n=1 Tax=Heterodera schachtii TaxID=97005 RepID=A0ABD2HYT6_HETSC